ncbi:HlyC/CorC family transporter [Holospora curviuscula]|uniref:Hemolysin C n=1 Tax=Holospora curviuscula TaxID=1082868 RepID=A0A2S5R903_9PROT|nr:CNNM domain-containing protein [Holospora curviuscula]PPE03806.1 Hemolysin C [Holospora curviuscula]
MLVIIFVLLIAIFAVLAAFLSASETAVTASSPFRLHQMAKKNPSVSVLLELQKQMPILISCLLFTNICLLNGMASIATELFRQYLGPFGLVIAPIVVSALTALYVEILPKIYVYQCPERAALFLVPLLQFLKRFLFPITLLMDRIAHYSLAWLGVSNTKEVSSTLEDLRGAIDLHAGSGIISHERAMLGSILDLSRVTVSEIMVHRKNIVSFSIDLPFEQLCEHLLTAPYTRIPLWKDSPDNIVGVIHVKNLMRYLQKKDKFKENSDIHSMIKAPWFIPETSTLFYQMQLFKEKHSHQAFVVDEYGSLLGMVTLEDILEEIVGEIRDEYDVDFPGVRTTPQETYLVRGCVTLRDLRRQYEWNFDEPSVSTLAGLILHTCRTIPEVGTVVRIKQFEMKILRVHHHQVTLIEVIPLAPSGTT